LVRFRKFKVRYDHDAVSAETLGICSHASGNPRTAISNYTSGNGNSADTTSVASTDNCDHHGDDAV
jgi:hypothetical protein